MWLTGLAIGQDRNVSSTALGLLVCASLYTGFQLTIRTVVYPQFDRVGAAEFPGYERSHQRRVSRVVGPLFAALVVATAAVVLDPPRGVSAPLSWAPVVLLLVVLGVTGRLAVPLHRALGRGFDDELHRRLLRIDSIRLSAALADTVLALALLLH
jgi:hypothetical protein